jgi:hypothetical protein
MAPFRVAVSRGRRDGAIETAPFRMGVERGCRDGAVSNGRQKGPSRGAVETAPFRRAVSRVWHWLKLDPLKTGNSSKPANRIEGRVRHELKDGPPASGLFGGH